MSFHKWSARKVMFPSVVYFYQDNHYTVNTMYLRKSQLKSIFNYRKLNCCDAYVDDRTYLSIIIQTLHKKWSFPLRISSVNKTKSAVSYGFGHIYSRNPSWKTLFFMQRKLHYKTNRLSWNFPKINLCHIWVKVFKNGPSKIF